MQYNPQKIEKKILDLWGKEKTYDKAKAMRKGKKPFFFMDGPPYATGSIHLGTAWNKIIKDMYLRFFRMKGFDVWDQPGYDTHGTPIETKVEKELGFKSKKDIEDFGMGKFIAKCREFATRHIVVMSEQFANLGVWMDWMNPYLTLNNSYIEGAWFTFKRAFEQGLLFKGKYPIHACPRCETVVAYNEIEYTKLTDTSIYVKFQLKKDPRMFLIIWTTTPWTLPGNTGVMVHPKYTYVKAQLSNGEVWIVAKERLQPLMDAIEAGYKILDEFRGKELEGLEYLGPLHDKLKMKGVQNGYRVILSERYVHLDDGTGLVHTAPGHGREDFEEGMKNGLPAICPVEISGEMTQETGKYAGKRAREVDAEIIKDLEESGELVYKHPYTHDYPICWRCESPLLQIGVPQWFFKVTAIRKKLLLENKKVFWIPDWAGQRFNDWLENLGDWPVSRQRYWGIPLPIWECGCGNIEVIGSFDELKKKSGLKKEIDLHRPVIDKIEVKCSKCGKNTKRIPDVLDVWFDAGVCTWASLGYPREKKIFNKIWPSDFQLEGPDQFRGWWNSEIITSVMGFNRAPFKSILMHGMVMDVKGVKLSKSKGNFIDPEDVIKKYGRDVMRFYLLSFPPWDNFYFNWEELKEVGRLFNVLWNVYLFNKTYGCKANPGQLNIEDKWILSRLNSVLETQKDAEKYQMHSLVKALWDFILNDFSRVYIKIIRNRVSPWYNGKDKKAAQWTLSHVIENLLRALAPISPFISDYMHRDLYGKSVHLCDFPKADKARIDKRIEDGMKIVESLLENVSALRQEKKVKLRWPIEELIFKLKSPEIVRLVKPLEPVICNLGNFKKITYVKRAPKGSKEFHYGKIAIGKVLKEEALVRELTRKVQMLRKEARLRVGDQIELFLKSDKGTETVLKLFQKTVSQGVGAKKIYIGNVQNKKGTLSFEGKKIGIGFRRVD